MRRVEDTVLRKLRNVLVPTPDPLLFSLSVHGISLLGESIDDINNKVVGKCNRNPLTGHDKSDKWRQKMGGGDDDGEHESSF